MVTFVIEHVIAEVVKCRLTTTEASAQSQQFMWVTLGQIFPLNTLIFSTDAPNSITTTPEIHGSPVITVLILDWSFITDLGLS